jgi:hypothetical protein
LALRPAASISHGVGGFGTSVHLGSMAERNESCSILGDGSNGAAKFHRRVEIRKMAFEAERLLVD